MYAAKQLTVFCLFDNEYCFQNRMFVVNYSFEACEQEKKIKELVWLLHLNAFGIHYHICC